MSVYDRFTDSASDLASGNDFLVTASGTDTGVVEITELGGTGDAEVYREIDEGQTGTFEISNQIAGPAFAEPNQTTGEWHSQTNRLWIGNDGTNTESRIKITNVSDTEQNYFAVGFEAGTE